MSLRQPAALASCALFAALFAALPPGLAACGGATTEGNEPALDAPGAPASAAPGTSSAPSGPSAPVKPPPPLGPYSGLVGTTDVSILVPLPVAGASTDFVRPTELGNHGVLLPESAVDAVLGQQARLEQTRTDPASGYGQLALISLRLDPCSARGGQGTCRSEVRAVFQAIYEKAAGAEDDPTAGSAATDGALHVMYDVPDAELVMMMREILTLKESNGGLALEELAPHPILAAQGLGGPFAHGLRDIVLYHLGDTRIGRITFFDHNLDPDGDGWRFGIFDRSAAGFVPGKVPLVNAGSQLVAGSHTSLPLAESSAFVFSPPSSPDSVESLVAANRPQPGSPQVSTLQGAFEAALRVQNPTLHTAESTDCANCHLAEGARLLGESVYGLTSPNVFGHTRSLAYRNEKTSVSNLHAFGYLHRKVSIMQRTANESVVVASAMEQRLAPK